MAHVTVRKTDAASLEVAIPSGGEIIAGDLTIPEDARGLVLFAHGSGSSRHSPRNRFVSGVIQKAGVATLLMDLLTTDEERLDLLTATHRFDIPLLASRLEDTVLWASHRPELHGLPVGFFGASTGAAAALAAAGSMGDDVRAVISRGGRPDLADASLAWVTAPTLLIVGELDQPVRQLNEEAFRRLNCEKEIHIVPGATHLFDEPGALEEVADLAAGWLSAHLGGTR
jgi:putative phosphoribosyl transferase